ncbi:polyprenyl synthetase family protein [Pseudomonas sp. IC_126]|uniref:polyprenyl synthetase family protein n=1 Tax=Pseudomonas sp. IC_126 TaxID=2547400 RepID=UPI0010407BEB|nr:polyprenyl synthetase family protein [Pseudomonas sp. IC_126]TCD22717.1 polyprenyl synthetase family protein [Pseudomonas sp. IC_126]
MATVMPNSQFDLERTLSALRAQVNDRLAIWLPHCPLEDAIGTAMRAGSLAPGKRIRPLLLLLALKDLQHEGSVESALDLGCALEMVHAASLFLDDMPCMDNAELRRGQPTIHRQFGEDVAVLGSVALLSQAFGIAASVEGIDPATRNRLVRLLATATGAQGLVRGQYHDLREGLRNRPLEAIAHSNRLKTCPLFTAAVEFAALLGGASDSCTRHLNGFATELGMAFQLLDDLADGLSPQHSGKDAGKDHGKSTMVTLLGPEVARQHVERHLTRAGQHLIDADIGDGYLARLLDYIDVWPR